MNRNIGQDEKDGNSEPFFDLMMQSLFACKHAQPFEGEERPAITNPIVLIRWRMRDAERPRQSEVVQTFLYILTEKVVIITNMFAWFWRIRMFLYMRKESYSWSSIQANHVLLQFHG